LVEVIAVFAWVFLPAAPLVRSNAGAGAALQRPPELASFPIFFSYV
jgi:hypothetical protein